MSNNRGMSNSVNGKMNNRDLVVVTGASTGIGAATVRALRAAGYPVLATARRTERLEALARECECAIVSADLQEDDGITAVVAAAEKIGPIGALVNNAGGALGLDSVAEGNPEEWRTMYERNVIATLRLTQAILPQLRERGGAVLTVTSTAAHDTYPGGAGYVAAKHAERIIVETLRVELVGEPVRVMEIAPGMVHTEEFSLNRFRGDHAKADQVYAGVDQPLVAEDIADAICWMLTRPAHVNIDSLIIRPRAQANNTVVARN